MDQNQYETQNNTDHQSNDTQTNTDYFAGNHTDGQPYDTPGGMHGFVYNTSDPTPKQKAGRMGRSVAITLCASCLFVLIIGGSLGVAWLTGRSSGRFFGSVGDDTTQEYEMSDTNRELVIADDTMADNILEVPTDTQGEGYDDLSYETLPNVSPSLSIDKKQPISQDKDDDGKADTAFDENGNVITSAGDVILNTATVVAKVASSVVEISTETLVESNRNGQYITSGAGSGVIIAKEGYIITNHHVIDGVDNIIVRLSNGKQFNAVLVGSDEATDIAVLFIDPDGYELTVAPMGCSFDLVAGEDVVAIGNPLGSLGGTVTEGIISATERHINMDGNIMTLLQVSSPINPGNSGGGLFNMAGELVGIVNAKVSSEEIEGLGFAIPVDVAYEIATELIQYRYVRGRVTTGLTLVDVTSTSTALYYFGTRATGVYVYDSEICADLQYGDRIVSIDGEALETASDLSKFTHGKNVGDTLEFVVIRKNKEVSVTMTLAEYVPEYLTTPEN